MDIPSSSGNSPNGAASEAAPFTSATIAAIPGSAPPAARTADSAACRVLVVDDDPLVRETCVRFLQHAGYSVAAANDGEGAWAALQRGGFHLLVTDHRMPRLTGVELVSRLRAERHTLPVILATATVPWDAANVPAELAPLTILEKPFGCDEFLTSVRAAVGSPATIPELAPGAPADV